jgi:hypothetical protein
MSIQNISRCKVYFMGSSVYVRYFRKVKYHFLNIEIKSMNERIIQGGKMYFLIFLFIYFLKIE